MKLIIGVILGIVGLFVIGVLFVKIQDSKEASAKKEAKNGILYKKIIALDKKYEFKEELKDSFFIKERLYHINGTYFRRTNSQKYEDAEFAYSCFVKEVVLPNIGFFENLLQVEKYNKQLYSHYMEEYNQILLQATSKVEKDLCEQEKARPLILASFTIQLYYKYYNEYKERDYVFYSEEIQEAINEAKKINKSKSLIQQERALMSDKLRFQVLKRDNYTCQICGKGAKDGVELEVDHIIPVSKGGKTIIDNLQTLCQRCNRGKRDKMMYDNNCEENIYYENEKNCQDKDNICSSNLASNKNYNKSSAQNDLKRKIDCLMAPYRRLD